MNNKRGFEFSFGWLFALLVGAVIIFLSIYATIKLVGTERTVQDTETAKQLEAILTPIETGTETAKSVTPIVFPSLTRVYNNCSIKGNFGEQRIAIATSSGIGEKWQEPGFEVASYNKYIFSPEIVEGKEVYVFSKPFSMPFKIANILFMWADKYCFVNPPTEIEEEIKSLNLRNINATPFLSACDKKSKKVCFYTEEPSCDVVVNPNMKSVAKKGKPTVFYEGPLLYGAILAEPTVYECQVKRLMKRAYELSLLYDAKSKGVAARTGGCSAELQADLARFATVSGEINNSAELTTIDTVAGSLKNENDKITTCRLWED
jgi:hypothetical protein